MDLKVTSQTFGNAKLNRNSIKNTQRILSDKSLHKPNNTQAYAGYIGWAVLLLFLVGSIATGAYKEIKNRIKNKAPIENTSQQNLK